MRVAGGVLGGYVSLASKGPRKGFEGIIRGEVAGIVLSVPQGYIPCPTSSVPIFSLD